MATYENASSASSSDEVVQAPLKAASAASSGLPVVEIPVVVINDKTYPIVPTNMVTGTLPTTKGGTGLSSLDGGRLLASNEDGTLLEEIDVDVQKLSGLKGNIQNQLDDTRRYVVSIPTTGWNENTGGDGYYQTITVKGMTESDNPIVGLVSSATTADALDAERTAYGCIDSIITAVDKITVYCFSEVPTAPFSISLNCTGA
jgi:hypothetical protein